MRTMLGTIALAATLLLAGSSLARDAITPATVAKLTAEVRAKPEAGAAVVATLNKDAAVSVTGQPVPEGKGTVKSGAANDTSRIRKAMIL